MFEGLRSSFFEHFASLLWGDGESAYLSDIHSHVDSDWESFSAAIMKICKRYSSSPDHSSTSAETAWNFLTNSKFNIDYCKHTSFVSVSLPTGIFSPGHNCSGSYLENEQNSDVSFCGQLLWESLESLHAVYESLKLDNLRKR